MSTPRSVRSSLHISVIIPVHDASAHLACCLASLSASTFRDFEIIVVDDASGDDSAAVARQAGALVVSQEQQSGPAAARNQGARRARGAILLFLDADVEARPDTLAEVARILDGDPELAAVFGSYDDEPADPGFFSQYKNLFHHYQHQHSHPDAVTFWTGCGAIRKTVFDEVGGLDQTRFAEPSIEDIELGYRLHKRGHRIRLARHLQVKHRKQWRLLSMLRADIVARALPWSRLILETGFTPNQLNLRWPSRVSALLAGVLLACLLLLPLPLLGLPVLAMLAPAIVAAASLVALVFLNRALYAFFVTKRGIGFAAGAVLCHLLYYLYSGTIFVGCWLTAAVAPRRV